MEVKKNDRKSFPVFQTTKTGGIRFSFQIHLNSKGVKEKGFNPFLKLIIYTLYNNIKKVANVPYERVAEQVDPHLVAGAEPLTLHTHTLGTGCPIYHV